MVQQTFPDVAEASDGAPIWESMFGRITDFLRGVVLPDEQHAPIRITSTGDSVLDGDDPSPMGRLGRLIPRLLLVLAVALLVAAIALFGFHAAYADKVYPAIAVGDVSVGGMTVEQAVATVEQRAAEFERGTVTFTYNGQTWTPTLAELGASIDVESSVDAAWELGRDESAVDRLGFTRQLLRSDQRVPLRTTVDLTVLAGWFEQVNADIDQRAVNADMVVDGTEGSISPEKSGIIVDEDAATELILGALESLEPVSTEMPTTTEVPKIFA
ncbi:MAG TPA: peptidoglycan binding domain-containing protein, partial [Thermomicrobiales bacterium]|nr:peptidoglycan binding domain-containing protein [Thermomicrobiales bacterium]